ncbi:hypothetical protein CHUAL_012083 [Chamberlinius hualienensis]
MISKACNNKDEILLHMSDELPIKIFKELIANIKPKNIKDESSLITSIRGIYFSIIFHLLTKGIDVNEAENKNNTPLMSVEPGEYYDIVNILVEYGAEINANNFYGETALVYAVRDDI